MTPTTEFRPSADAVPTPAELFGLDGHVAVVTGTSSGLGDRFARVLHRAGAAVALVARRRERLDAMAAELGNRALAVVGDVADDEAAAAAIARTIEHFGRLDILVNNAGRANPGPAERADPTAVRATIDVNLVAPFVLSQHAVTAMRQRGGGSIVNVSSILGLVAGSPINDAAYAASKGGLVSLTRELAVQWAPHNIRVNALAPGWFPTEMNAEMFADDRTTRWIERQTPIGRAGRVGELDGALLFLASRASSFMTGQVLVVDGGWTAR